MAKNGKKMNVGLFIVLLIVFFPAAIVYAIVSNVESKPNANLNGHKARMVTAILWILNSAGLMIIYWLYGLPTVVTGAVMLACELKNKNSKNKKLLIGYIVSFVLTIAVVSYTGFIVYCIPAAVVSLVGLVGIYRGLKK